MAETEDTEPKQHGICFTILYYVGVLVAVVLVVWGVRTYVGEPYEIPSGSMEDTLEVGDYILGAKLGYPAGAPAHGDIITFISPENSSETFIKRVIATEGETVDLQNGSVEVNEVALDEPYTQGKLSAPLSRTSAKLPEGISFPYTVPEGKVWVMGDNRTNSLDSRYFGAIPVSSITSHAVFRVFPFSRFGSL